jgi:hypothetical protein
MRLNWHQYRYYPYERELAAREAASLLRYQSLQEVDGGLELTHVVNANLAERLTYFAGFVNGHGMEETLQARLEAVARSGRNRQATRYSVHGLHEYKGKFNPQIAKALLNILEVKANDRVLDPFCGSGTTLVEASQLKAIGYGTDLNPLAVFVANAKLLMLATPGHDQRASFEKIARKIRRTTQWTYPLSNDQRTTYLLSWFNRSILHTIERLREIIENTADKLSPIFLAIASNLLREYSLQDPNDLRIRRRKSALPDLPLAEAFLAASSLAIERAADAQKVLGTKLPKSKAVLSDVAELALNKRVKPFDAAITSPPYAMALPYIDTQRLSLVWLRLLGPEEISQLEADLIGSREMRGTARRTLLEDMLSNTSELPASEAKFCVDLQASLGSNDGFRRQAVPALLYRYFSGMSGSLKAVRAVMKPRASFALIVGHNHSTLGGKRTDIDTPRHLANLARHVGWEIDELLPLQTYRRYGLHASNAVEAETLLLLRNC